MTWLTQQDLSDAFGDKELIQLTDRDNNGTIDSAVIARAIREAENEVAGILSRSIPSWPTPSVPLGVVDKACHIARRYLYDTRVPEAVESFYKSAIDWLKSASFSDEELGITDSSESSTSGGGGIVAPKITRDFGSNFADQYSSLTIEAGIKQ